MTKEDFTPITVEQKYANGYTRYYVKVKNKKNILWGLFSLYETLFVSKLEGNDTDFYFLTNHEYFSAMFGSVEDAHKAYDEAIESKITEYNSRLISTKEI